MTFSERRQRMRGILAGDVCVHPGSVFDPISARIAEDLGFELGMFAGSIASFTVLGAPDIVVLTLSEFAEQIRRITRAGGLPLLVDADHGYGNALNVMRTVVELEAAGVAGMSIEDTVLPRGYGDDRVALLPIDEGVGKIRAALAARTDSSLAIAARTSAVTVTGIADAVARAKAYDAVGPDAVFFTGISTIEQLQAIRAVTSLPIILGGGVEALGGLSAVAPLGVRIALQGHHPFMASVQATYETLKAFRDGVPAGALTNQPSTALMKQVSRDADYSAAMRDFMES